MLVSTYFVSTTRNMIVFGFRIALSTVNQGRVTANCCAHTNRFDADLMDNMDNLYYTVD